MGRDHSPCQVGQYIWGTCHLVQLSEALSTHAPTLLRFFMVRHQVGIHARLLWTLLPMHCHTATCLLSFNKYTPQATEKPIPAPVQLLDMLIWHCPSQTSASCSDSIWRAIFLFTLVAPPTQRSYQVRESSSSFAEIILSSLGH